MPYAYSPEGLLLRWSSSKFKLRTLALNPISSKVPRMGITEIKLSRTILNIIFNAVVKGTPLRNIMAKMPTLIAELAMSPRPGIRLNTASIPKEIDVPGILNLVSIHSLKKVMASRLF